MQNTSSARVLDDALIVVDGQAGYWVGSTPPRSAITTAGNVRKNGWCGQTMTEEEISSAHATHVCSRDESISADDVSRGQVYILGGKEWIEHVCTHDGESDPSWLKLLERRKGKSKSWVNTLAILALPVVTVPEVANRLVNIILETVPKMTNLSFQPEETCTVKLSLPYGWDGRIEDTEVGLRLSVQAKRPNTVTGDKAALALCTNESDGSIVGQVRFLIRNGEASEPLGIVDTQGRDLNVLVFIETTNPIFRSGVAL